MIEMRLFIGIAFSGGLKKELWQVAQKLKAQASKGNFTREDNFHLTLAFLGELPQEAAGELQRILDITRGKPFCLELGKLGRFKRTEGDIYWLGLNPPRELLEYHSLLREKLENKGFRVEKGQFKPHITLGRKIVLNPGADLKGMDSLIFKQKVEKISLFHSCRIEGKLTYIPLHESFLGQERL